MTVDGDKGDSLDKAALILLIVLIILAVIAVIIVVIYNARKNMHSTKGLKIAHKDLKVNPA